MKLLLLHPLPMDGSVFSDDLRSLGDDCVAPTLYAQGDDIRLRAPEVDVDGAVGTGELVSLAAYGDSCVGEQEVGTPVSAMTERKASRLRTWR